MASANLDLVRSIFAAWGRGDFFRSADWAHPEIEFVMVDGPDPGRWVGLGAVAERWRAQLSPWEDWRAEAEEYRRLDDERVLVLVHSGGRGKTSGLEIGQMRSERAALLHVRDGKVTRLVLYWDRERALANLGLAPEGDTS